jgi:hypothetical protein
MARIRSVKPELRRDLTVAEWSRECRYAWVLLWGYLDDHGRGLDDLRLLVADLFPLDRDVTERKLDGWLNRMCESGDGCPPLCRYEVGGRRYLHAPKWNRSQRVSHPQESRIPPCPEHEASRAVPEPLPKHNGTAPSSFATSRAPEDLGSKGAREREVLSAVADPPRDDVEGLCRYFATAVAKNGVKATITDRWRTEARLLLDKDERQPVEVRAVIDWATADEFWRPNVLSVPKLREKYDQLRLGMNRARPTTAGNVATAWVREQG